MNKTYQIPTDKRACCYNNKTEVLETPSSIPEDLRLWTSLNLEDYSNIINKCNNHLKRKENAKLLLLLMIFVIAACVVLFIKKPFSVTYVAIILAGSLLLIIILHFIVLIRANLKLNKTVEELNTQYSNKGIKVAIQGVVVGSGKNRSTVTRIYIDYNEDWNRQPKPQVLASNIQPVPNHIEIELSSIQPQQSPQAPSYYTSPIPPPSAPYSPYGHPVSLYKDVDDSNTSNNNNNNNNSNYNNNNNQSLQYNYDNNNNNIPIDNPSFQNNK